MYVTLLIFQKKNRYPLLRTSIDNSEGVDKNKNWMEFQVVCQKLKKNRLENYPGNLFKRKLVYSFLEKPICGKLNYRVFIIGIVTACRQFSTTSRKKSPP